MFLHMDIITVYISITYVTLRGHPLHVERKNERKGGMVTRYLGIAYRVLEDTASRCYE